MDDNKKKEKKNKDEDKNKNKVEKNKKEKKEDKNEKNSSKNDHKVEKKKEKNKEKNKNNDKKEDTSFFDTVVKVAEKAFPIIEKLAPLVMSIVNKLFAKPVEQTGVAADQSTMDSIATNTEAKDAIASIITSAIPLLSSGFAADTQAQSNDKAQSSPDKKTIDLSSILAQIDPKVLASILSVATDKLGKKMDKNPDLPSPDSNVNYKLKTLEDGKAVVKAKAVEKVIANDVKADATNITASAHVDAPPAVATTTADATHYDDTPVAAMGELHVEDHA